MENYENSITLRGELVALPRFSHENHAKRFFCFELAVARLSGAVDVLPVIAPQALVEALNPCAGAMIQVTGQVRSHNLRQEGRRRLLIFVFAGDVQVCDGAPCNEVLLRGTVCRLPSLRRTPLGREICDVMLAVPRAFRRADFLPCILWGQTAQQAAACEVGQVICIQGRMQSRGYTKQTDDGPQQRTAYEISALTAQIP